MTNDTIYLAPGREIKIWEPDPDPFVITAEDGRVLLALRKDCSVDGAMEDAGEAAKVFMRAHCATME